MPGRVDLSLIIYVWDMVMHACNIQGVGGGANDGRQCREAVSCMWECGGMYAWDVVTGMCSIRGVVGGMMNSDAGTQCPAVGHMWTCMFGMW